MPIWRIHPVAHPRDSRWQGRRIWEEVIVRADCAALARMIAAKLDEPAVPYRLGNETQCFRSGLQDEKLYWARRLDDADAGRYATAKENDGVIAAVPLTDGGQESARR